MVINTKKNGVDPWWEIRGSSEEEKPTNGVPTGSIFIEVDTGDIFFFDSNTGVWTSV